MSFRFNATEVRERYGVSTPAPAPVACFAERHYTPLELAGAWRLSVGVVRRLFEREPGVLIFGDARGTRSKRPYRTLRIPPDVAERVYHRLQHVYNQQSC